MVDHWLTAGSFCGAIFGDPTLHHTNYYMERVRKRQRATLDARAPIDHSNSTIKSVESALCTMLELNTRLEAASTEIKAAVSETGGSAEEYMIKVTPRVISVCIEVLEPLGFAKGLEGFTAAMSEIKAWAMDNSALQESIVAFRSYFGPPHSASGTGGSSRQSLTRATLRETRR